MRKKTSLPETTEVKVDELEEKRQEELTTELPKDADDPVIPPPSEEIYEDTFYDIADDEDEDGCNCLSVEQLVYAAAQRSFQEAEFLSDVAAKCRVELCEMLLQVKADQMDTKFKERYKALQDFVTGLDARADALYSRAGNLFIKE